MNDEKCTRYDLRVEVVATANAEDDGSPIPDVFDWEVNSGNEPYYCGLCGKDFAYWEDALAHVGEAVEVAA
jgi:hypothetical protein